MKPKLFLFFALLLVGSLLVAGCAGAPARGWSGAVVADNTLYVGAMPGKVVRYVLLSEPEPLAVEKERFDLPQGAGGGFLACGAAAAGGVYSTPFVSGGKVYIGAYVDEDRGKVYALDALNMTRIWEYPVGGFIGAIVGSPVVEGDTLYIGSSDGRLYALNAETGQERWQFQTGDDIWATPAVADGVVYVGSFDHNLYAVDAQNGEEMWRFSTGGAIASTPLIHNGVLYFGSFDRKFYAINLDGTEKWRFEDAGSWFWGKAVAYDDIIIAGCLDHRVYALYADSGEQAWQPYQAGGQVRADSALVGELVILGSEDGKVYALRAGTGALAWVFTADGPIRAALFASESTVYVHTVVGTLYALETEHGTRLWSVTTSG